MNDYNLVIEAIQNFINNTISYEDLEILFYKYFVDSDFEFSTKQACILDDVHKDIEMFSCEWNLKEKNDNKQDEFKNHLKIHLNLLK